MVGKGWIMQDEDDYGDPEKNIFTVTPVDEEVIQDLAREQETQ